MRLGILNAKHDTYDADLWARYDALYCGGQHFRRMLGRFLPKNPVEADDVYTQRCGEASYRNYVGAIVDKFASHLLTAPLTLRAVSLDTHEPVDSIDTFYQSFKEDVDGVGTDLVDFARSAFRTSLIKGSCWFVAAMPSNAGKAPRNRSEWAAIGLGNIKVASLAPEHVLDWECDESGDLLWAVVYEETRPRVSLTSSRSAVRRVWRYYDRANVETFELTYDPKVTHVTEDTEVPSVSVEPHGFSRVPLVHMSPPPGLWLMNRVADPQVEHFRLSAGLGWAIRRTCYATPVFRMEGGASGQGPTMGAGYFLIVGANDKVEYAAPPSEPFKVISDEIKAQKDEIYRVSQLMADGVDNNAAAVGRSGDSKQADAAATEVCLLAYGAVVREAIERLYDLVGDGRGDPYRFSVGGLDSFNLSDPTTVVENATTAKALAIPSKTFAQELMVSVADALMPGLDQDVKDAIRREILQGTTEPEEPEEASEPEQEDEKDDGEQEQREDDLRDQPGQR